MEIIVVGAFVLLAFLPIIADFIENDDDSCMYDPFYCTTCHKVHTDSCAMLKHRP